MMIIDRETGAENRDLLWKAIIEDLPEDFFRFFFPMPEAEKDPEKKIEFLSTDILRNKQVDKILKIPMLDGSTAIIYCAVQGSPEVDFSKRIFGNFNRLWNEYDLGTSVIAILTDGDPAFRPGTFQCGQVTFRYTIYKVLDQSEEELEKSENPFALVVLATRAALKRKNGQYSENEYFQRKVALLNWLKNKSVSDFQEMALLSFLKYYLPFEDKILEQRFDEQLKKSSKAMRTVEFLIGEAKESSRAEAWVEGLDRGNTSCIKALIARTPFPDQKIAEMTGLAEEFIASVRARMTAEIERCTR